MFKKVILEKKGVHGAIDCFRDGVTVQIVIGVVVTLWVNWAQFMDWATASSAEMMLAAEGIAGQGEHRSVRHSTPAVFWRVLWTPCSMRWVDGSLLMVFAVWLCRESATPASAQAQRQHYTVSSVRKTLWHSTQECTIKDSAGLGSL